MNLAVIFSLAARRIHPLYLGYKFDSDITGYNTDASSWNRVK